MANTTNNNGSCDAQGGANAVNCVQQVQPSNSPSTQPPSPVTKSSTPSAPETNNGSPSSGSSAQVTLSSPPTDLTPVGQAGWTLDWHKQVYLQSQGIIITRIGPQAANGGNSDILYIPGNGWTNGNESSLFYWPATIRPGPATIYSYIMNVMSQTGPDGIVSHPGDTIDWISLSTDVVSYIYVTGVSSQGVNIDMWVWTKS